MQSGNFDLVGTIIYEIDQHPYQSTFFNGTIDVAEAGGFLSIESVFLVTLGIALIVLLGLWIHGQIQNLSKVHKAAKIELLDYLFIYLFSIEQQMPDISDFKIYMQHIQPHKKLLANVISKRVFRIHFQVFDLKNVILENI